MNKWDLSLAMLRTDLASLEDIQEQEQGQGYNTPCDYPDSEGHFHCPFDASGGDDCRRYCSLGVDE